MVVKMRSQEIAQILFNKLQTKSILITLNAIEYLRLKLKGLEPEVHLNEEKEIIDIIESHINNLTNIEKEEILFSLYTILFSLAQKISQTAGAG
jgi:hypothetical protein